MKENENKMQITQDLERFAQSEFVDKVKDPNELFLFKCTGCGGVHFRHAGYVLITTPYVSAKTGANASSDSIQVQVCVSCKKSFIHYEGRYKDITEHIDLKAWKKSEKKLNEATGPGGEC